MAKRKTAFAVPTIRLLYIQSKKDEKISSFFRLFLRHAIFYSAPRLAARRSRIARIKSSELTAVAV